MLEPAVSTVKRMKSPRAMKDWLLEREPWTRSLISPVGEMKLDGAICVLVIVTSVSPIVRESICVHVDVDQLKRYMVCVVLPLE